MAIDDVYVFTLSASQASSLRQNNLAFIRTSSTEPDATTCAALAVLIKDIHRPNQSQGVTYTGWRARQVRGTNVTRPTTGKCNPVGGNLFEGLFTTNTNGELIGGGDDLPPQCAMVTTLRTTTVGRRARGRFYAFGFAENQQAGGVWNSTYLGNINTAWASFLATHAIAAPTDGWRLVIWSERTASGCAVDAQGNHVHVDPPNPAMAATPVVSHLVRSTVYTQRRRVAGIGL